MSDLFQGNKAGCDSITREVGDFCRRHPDDHDLAGIYWNDFGIMAMLANDADSAIACYQRSRKHLAAAGDTARFCDVSINLSSLYRNKGEMAHGANVLQEALVMLPPTKTELTTTRFAVLYMLGAIYGDMYCFAIADSYFRQAGGLLRKASINDQCQFYNARGNRFFFAKQYRQAWDDFVRMRKLAVELNNPILQAIAESDMGEILHSQGKDIDALPLLLKAGKTFNDAGGSDAPSLAYLNDLIASTMAHLGRKADALHRFESTDTAAIAKHPRYMMVHYERLADFYHLNGNDKAAYDCIESARRHETEFRNRLFGEQMADAQQRYQRDKKVMSQHTEIERQHEQADGLRAIIFIIVGFAIVIFALTLWAARRKRQIMQLQYQHELTDLSLKNIRNRLSPHFIMNVLGRELPLNNEGVIRLIKFIRQNLMLVERNVIPLAEELDFVNTYVALERKALPSEFDYVCHADDSVDMQKVLVPAMMVQVFVENAVKHGLRGQAGALYLHVNIVTKGSDIVITVDNNGSEAQSTTQGSQTGIRVMQQTIDLFNKSNTNPIRLSYGPEPNGVWHVGISIPQDYIYRQF
jgi:tetratricopeptide (TPR) repeat protein